MSEPEQGSRWSQTRLGLLVAGIAGLVFVVVAAVYVPWAWLPGGHVRAVAADTVFTASEIARGERVSGALRHAAWANLALTLLVACVLGFSRWGSRLVARLPGRWWLQAVTGCLILTAVAQLVQVPLAWHSQRIDLAEGLSRQSWGSWASDQATTTLVTWVFTAIALLAVIALARRLPRTWPLWAGGAAMLLAVLGSFVYPVVVEPLFNHFQPLPAGPLRTDIFALARREQVGLDDVLVADASRRTTTLNAYVSGFGGTRRVVIYDTVLTALPRPQIEVIVAHELGHARHDDVLLGTVLGAFGSAVGIGLLAVIVDRRRIRERVGITGAGDPRAVPLLMALVAVAAFAVSPVQNTISRGIEARADREALAATGDAATFIAMQRQLALRSLADPTPPGLSFFWFGSHPTTLQRIGLAQEFFRK